VVASDFARLRYFKPENVPAWDKVSFDVVWNLERLVDRVGIRPVIISSWRSPSKNEAVGGHQNSQHLVGKALDIWWGGNIDLVKVYNLALAQGSFGGIGLYYPEMTMHLDTGPKNQLGLTRLWSRIGGKTQPYQAITVALDKLKALVKKIDTDTISSLLWIGIFLSALRR